MKIYIPSRAKTGDIGGGFSFTRNIIKALKGKVEFTDRIADCDIFFIPGATMCQRDEVKTMKDMGKKIVLRVDNIPRNSRNRNTGTGRLYDFAQMADEVIYQSEWARNWISPFVKKKGVVILNGADEEIFTPDGMKAPRDGSPQYLYSRYNRDETKCWEKAWYEFQITYYRNPKAHLWIVGRFSPEQEQYGFDFFGGAEKRYKYLGTIGTPEEMAIIYRSANNLLYTYSLDACSNVLVEARLCGLDVLIGQNEGSANEILLTNKINLTLKSMGERYYQVFKKVLCTK